MRSSSSVYIMGVVGAMILGASGAAAQSQVRLRVLAKVGDSAPALGPGRIITSLGTPSIADNGLVAYTIADEFESALVVANVWDATSKRVAIREAAIPNTSLALQTIIQHHVLNSGRLAAVGLLSGSSVPAGASGAMVETALGPELTAFAGMGYIGDGSYLASIDSCRVNPTGSMLIVGTLTGAGVGVGGPQVVLRVDQNAFGTLVTPLIRTGEPVSPESPDIVARCDEEGIAINASGVVLASVLVQRDKWLEPRTVLVMQAPGSTPSQVLGPGDSVVRGGQAYAITTILDASINDAGSLAFAALADCPLLGLVDASIVGRVFDPLGPGRAVTIDSVGGDPLGGTPSGTTCGMAHFVWSVSPDRAIVSGVASGPGVTSYNDTFLALDDGHALTSVLREGDPGPELPAGVMIAYLSRTIAISPDGFAAVSADLLGPDFQQSNRFALFLLTPGGQPRLAARFGQNIQLGPGLAMPLRGFAYNSRSNGQDGRARAIARGGRLYFRADFDDGVFAVIEASLSGCNPADVASLGAAPMPDQQLTADDIVVYLAAFFAGETTIADIASLGGAAPSDGQITADDLVAFLGMFFAGCP